MRMVWTCIEFDALSKAEAKSHFFFKKKKKSHFCCDRHIVSHPSEIYAEWREFLAGSLWPAGYRHRGCSRTVSILL